MASLKGLKWSWRCMAGSRSAFVQMAGLSGYRVMRCFYSLLDLHLGFSHRCQVSDLFCRLSCWGRRARASCGKIGPTVSILLWQPLARWWFWCVVLSSRRRVSLKMCVRNQKWWEIASTHGEWGYWRQWYFQVQSKNQYSIDQSFRRPHEQHEIVEPALWDHVR